MLLHILNQLDIFPIYTDVFRNFTKAFQQLDSIELPEYTSIDQKGQKKLIRLLLLAFQGNLKKARELLYFYKHSESDNPEFSQYLKTFHIWFIYLKYKH